MQAAGRARIAFDHAVAALRRDDPVEGEVSAEAQRAHQLRGEAFDLRGRRGVEVVAGAALQPVARPVHRMREQHAVARHRVRAAFLAGAIALGDPVALFGQRRRRGGQAVRMHAHVHAEARVFRFQDQRRAAGPVARLLQAAHAHAVGHVHVGIDSARQVQEVPFAVQRAQRVERVHQYVQLRRQGMPVAGQVEHFLAGRQQQRDALARDQRVEVGDVGGRRVACRGDAMAGGDRVRPTGNAAGHAVGQMHAPALRGEAARQVQRHRCACAGDQDGRCVSHRCSRRQQAATAGNARAPCAASVRPGARRAAAPACRGRRGVRRASG